MPQIIVTADRAAAFGEGAVTLRERVSVADFESEHFAAQLVERLGWAVGDADEVERVEEFELPAEMATELGESTADRGDPITDPRDPITDPGEAIAEPADRVSVPSPA
jgi:hypothetical protein